VSDREKGKFSGGMAALAILLLLLLPVLYVLSIGPAAYYYRDVDPLPGWRNMYMPLWRLGEAVPLFDRLLSLYIALWIGDHPSP
jgi:hypothetical protein